jgi:hypothetical protein
MLKSWEKYSNALTTNKACYATIMKGRPIVAALIQVVGYPSRFALVFRLFLREVRPQPIIPAPAAVNIEGT